MSNADQNVSENNWNIPPTTIDIIPVDNNPAEVLEPAPRWTTKNFIQVNTTTQPNVWTENYVGAETCSPCVITPCCGQSFCVSSCMLAHTQEKCVMNTCRLHNHTIEWRVNAAPTIPTIPDTVASNKQTAKSLQEAAYEKEIDLFLNKISMSVEVKKQPKKPSPEKDENVKKKTSVKVVNVNTEKKSKDQKKEVVKKVVKKKENSKKVTKKEKLKMKSIVKAKIPKDNINKIRKQLEQVENEITKRKLDLQFKEMQIKSEIDILRRRKNIEMLQSKIYNTSTDISNKSSDEDYLMDIDQHHDERDNVHKIPLKSVVKVPETSPLKVRKPIRSWVGGAKSNRNHIFPFYTDKSGRHDADYYNKPRQPKIAIWTSKHNTQNAYNKLNEYTKKRIYKTATNNVSVKELVRPGPSNKREIELTIRIVNDLAEPINQANYETINQVDFSDQRANLTIDEANLEIIKTPQPHKDTDNSSTSDVSFLDDFNVDDIVEYLKVTESVSGENENKMDINEKVYSNDLPNASLRETGNKDIIFQNLIEKKEMHEESYDEFREIVKMLNCYESTMLINDDNGATFETENIGGKPVSTSKASETECLENHNNHILADAKMEKSIVHSDKKVVTSADDGMIMSDFSSDDNIFETITKNAISLNDDSSNNKDETFSDLSSTDNNILENMTTNCIVTDVSSVDNIFETMITDAVNANDNCPIQKDQPYSDLTDNSKSRAFEIDTIHRISSDEDIICHSDDTLLLEPGIVNSVDCNDDNDNTRKNCTETDNSVRGESQPSDDIISISDLSCCEQSEDVLEIMEKDYELVSESIDLTNEEKNEEKLEESCNESTDNVTEHARALLITIFENIKNNGPQPDHPTINPTSEMNVEKETNVHNDPNNNIRQESIDKNINTNVLVTEDISNNAISIPLPEAKTENRENVGPVSNEALRTEPSQGPGNLKPIISLVPINTLMAFEKEDAEINHEIARIQQRVSNLLHGEFTISEIIHKGSYSNVYKCKDAKGRSLAAKITHPQVEGSKKGLHKENMLRKMQRSVPAQKLKCVFLVNGLAVDGRWCYIFEYYPWNLEQVMKTYGPFHIDNIQNLARQLVSAILLLRTNEIVHSDINPKHILLSHDFKKLKLCGFDEAYYSQTMRFVSYLGTVHYRAPEIILGHSMGHSIDVWSAAVVLHEMATNVKIFPGTTNNEVLYQQFCIFGNAPLPMISCSVFKDAHFLGNKFLRRCFDTTKKTGGEMQTELIPNFKKTSRMGALVFSAYYRTWGSKLRPRDKEADVAKIRQFSQLLSRMFTFDPAFRIPIEFVYAHPFIYQ